MKTPSGKRQARLKVMAASGRRGGARSSGDGRWGKDGGFGGAAPGLAAAYRAGRRGGGFFVGWMAIPSKRKGYGVAPVAPYLQGLMAVAMVEKVPDGPKVFLPLMPPSEG